jgi:hypothetical protein
MSNLGIAPFLRFVSPHISAQGRNLGGMIDQVQTAFRQENDSRVSQVREMRRMQHAHALKQLEMKSREKMKRMELQARRPRDEDSEQDSEEYRSDYQDQIDAILGRVRQARG